MCEAPRSDGFKAHPFAPQQDFSDNTVSNLTRPATSAIITVRVIKSFEFRTMKALVLRGVDLTQLTPARLIAQCKSGT